MRNEVKGLNLGQAPAPSGFGRAKGSVWETEAGCISEMVMTKRTGHKGLESLLGDPLKQLGKWLQSGHLRILPVETRG